MTLPGDQIPPDLRTLAAKVAELQRQITELRAARRLENATVGAGGLTVGAGGRFSVVTPDGQRLVDTGPIADPTYNNGDGSPQQAVFLRRQDGTLALSLFASPGSGSTQFAALWDAEGNIVVADDAASGTGLARPYLPVPMWPALDAGWDYWPRTAAAAMAQLWQGVFYRQQPRLVVVAQAGSDVSGTTGQVQLTINGAPQGSPQSVVFGVATYTFGPYDLSSYGQMTQLPLAVTARRTAGTGSIRASVVAAYTLQS